MMCSFKFVAPAVAMAKAAAAAAELDLRLETRDEVTTMPALADKGVASAEVAQLERGVQLGRGVQRICSDSVLPLLAVRALLLSAGQADEVRPERMGDEPR